MLKRLKVKVVRQWPEWESGHICFMFTRTGGKYEAHDVVFFIDPYGKPGWIDGKVYEGGYAAMRQHYDLIGWRIIDWWVVNDMGNNIKQL